MSSTRSKVVIQNSSEEPVLGVAMQLLNVLGHDVSLVDSPEAAMNASASSPTDLLVLSVTDPDEQSYALDRIALLPKSQQPKQVAILSDGEGDLDLVRPRGLPNVKVHVFVKPVHALGLLNVIKRMA